MAFAAALYSLRRICPQPRCSPARLEAILTKQFISRSNMGGVDFDFSAVPDADWAAFDSAKVAIESTRSNQAALRVDETIKADLLTKEKMVKLSLGELGTRAGEYVLRVFLGSSTTLTPTGQPSWLETDPPHLLQIGTPL
jgi:hypothetical protein